MISSVYYRIIITGFVLLSTKFLAFNNDSLKKARVPRHYFKTTIYSDFYTTGKRNLNGISVVSKKLKTYQLNQFALGFNAPIFTRDFYKKDSTQISNFHILITGSYASVTPIFEGIKVNHQLSKMSLGTRAIFNTGKKSVFFADFSPFVTQDNGYEYTKEYRFATSLVYNCAVSSRFTFRVGYTRSFLFGNRYHLPYIGIRLGKLDGVNFSVQFPRSMSFNVPLGKYVKTSLYTKPQGGVYSFANTDSLYYLTNDRSLQFGRVEFLGGFRLDVVPSRFFNLYVGAGFTSQNYIAFYSKTFNAKNKGAYHAFYNEKINNSLFINIGFAFKFGKSKSIYNNYNLYDAHDLNSGIDGGENNINTGNSEIPSRQKKIKNIEVSDVQDLIEEKDLY